MPNVIKLIAKPRKAAALGDSSLGDRIVFSHDLYQDGRKVGMDGGVSTVVRVDDDVRSLLCTMTMRLKDGSISLQALLEDAFPPVPFYAAITGGTGLYSAAHGEMYVYPASPEEHCYRLYLEGGQQPPPERPR
jgi:hypothetical protein